MTGFIHVLFERDFYVFNKWLSFQIEIPISNQIKSKSIQFQKNRFVKQTNKLRKRIKPQEYNICGCECCESQMTTKLNELRSQL